jgi:putative glycosyltransferase (TIGR04348 family)
MRIIMACPAPPQSRKGNRVTAVRWANLLKELGHQVTISDRYEGGCFDLMIALHARKSHPAIKAFSGSNPHRPLIVGLTGTDLYRDLRTSKAAQASLEWADRLIVLQPLARDALLPHLRAKVRVIYQSALPTKPRPKRKLHSFEIAVLGHLRAEKDPFRAALALRHLPKDSRIHITHAGQALTETMARRAHQLMKRDSRYRWLEEVSNRQSRRILARSRALVVSSLLEGGANVVSEAIADGVPVLASYIAGNVGLLGADYPGYFPKGDARQLAELMQRCETDAEFLAQVRNRIEELTPLVDPEREKKSLQDLLSELGG